MKKVSRTSKKGFTLVELLVVIGIIGLLAAIILPKFTGYTEKAIMKDAVTQARKVYTDITAYYAEKGKYPTVESVASAGGEKCIRDVVNNVNVKDAQGGGFDGFTTVPKAVAGTGVTTDKDGNYLKYTNDGNFTFYFIKGSKLFTVGYTNEGVITETLPTEQK